jgi:hypothetical protein
MRVHQFGLKPSFKDGLEYRMLSEDTVERGRLVATDHIVGNLIMVLPANARFGA